MSMAVTMKIQNVWLVGETVLGIFITPILTKLTARVTRITPSAANMNCIFVIWIFISY